MIYLWLGAAGRICRITRAEAYLSLSKAYPAWKSWSRLAACLDNAGRFNLNESGDILIVCERADIQ